MDSWIATYLIYTVLVEAMFTFVQLPKLFRCFIVTQAYQATVTFRDSNGSTAIFGLSNQIPGVFRNSE